MGADVNVMSSNKNVVERYLRAMSTMDRPTILLCLADDVERVEWAHGFPDSGVPVRGKAALIENLDRPAEIAMRIEITRMTEENDVVVVESIVHLSKEHAAFLKIQACSIYELENGKIRRMNSFTAEVTTSA